jgi:hypothetical protein
MGMGVGVGTSLLLRLACILQCGYRQWMARRRVWRLLIRRQRRGEIRKRAVLLIQTVYRGYKLRKLLKWWVWAAFTIQVRRFAASMHMEAKWRCVR